jgi:plastocyanin
MAQPCFAALILAMAVLMSGCGGGGECCDPILEDPTVTKTDGDEQVGRVGQPLPNPLQVSVLTEGAATPGATVNWSTTAAGGALNPTSTTTDANGVASSSWTLGTASGVQTATVSVSGAAGSAATFSANALAGPAAALEDASGNGQTGEINTALTQPLVAIATDEFGNAVAGVAVNWAATGATVSASTDVTDAAGVSDVTVTLGGTAGPITITAASQELEGSPVTFTATATESAAIPTTADVTVQDNDFVSVRNSTANPAVDTVAVGGTVTWTWAPATYAPHDITSTGSPGFSGRASAIMPPPYSHTFTAPGTYNYYCTFHAQPGSGMIGRIVVR